MNTKLNTYGINRRTLLQGAAATAAVGAAVSFGTAAAQEAATVNIGVSEDGYRTDERANVGFYPLNTGIFESLVKLTNGTDNDSAPETEAVAQVIYDHVKYNRYYRNPAAEHMKA